MTFLSHITPTVASVPVSPLVLSDLLLRLAADADSAGLRTTAEHLLDLASDVLDEPLVSRM